MTQKRTNAAQGSNKTERNALIWSDKQGATFPS